MKNANHSDSIQLWLRAFFCAAPHYLLLLLLQQENLIFYIPAQAQASPSIWELASMQVDFILVTLALTAMYGLLLPIRKGGFLIAVVLALFNSYIVLDQVLYTLTFAHFGPSQLENNIGDVFWLWDSFVATLDGVFVVNVLFVIMTAVGVYRFANSRAWPGVKTRHTMFIAIPLMLASGTGLSVQTPDRLHLTEHPFRALVLDSLGTQSAPVMSRDKAEKILAAAAVKVSESQLEPVPVKSVAVNKQPKPLNIVLIVLESIGAKQLLPNGKPDPVITPFLAKLAQHGKIYDAVYASYPASVVSNVAISTGGRSLTWGKVANLSHRYMGSTLAGEYQANSFATGLFSSADLDFGHLGDFFRGIGFDQVFDFGKQQSGFRYVAKLNSWGGDDAAVLARAQIWAQKQSANGRPFYLRVQTNFAHHPYNIPVAPNPAISNANPSKQKYLNAVNHLDSLLNDFYSKFKRAGLADNTVFAITGDHGEAFGEWHATNYLHRNFLYEENIRSFLILANQRLYPSQVRIATPVGQGDIMPTLLALNGLATPAEIPGQNLLSKKFKQRIQFFHKNNHPESWGLRDGRWKYIATFSADATELYDLEQDPDEQHNLAASSTFKNSGYQQLLTAWYVVQNKSFVNKLEGARSVAQTEYRPEDFRKRGPTAMKVGYYKPQSDGEIFVESEQLNPDEALFVWTKWLSYRRPHQVEYKVTSPSGNVFNYSRRIGPDDIITEMELPIPRPRETGNWHLQLSDKNSATLQEVFELTQSVPVLNASQVPLRSDRVNTVIVNSSKHTRRAFKSGSSLLAGEMMQLEIHWPRASKQRIVIFNWRGPKGKSRQYPVYVKPGQINSVVIHNGPYPMQPGTWWLTLWERGRQIASKLYRIGPTSANLLSDEAVSVEPARRTGVLLNSATHRPMKST